MSKTTSYLGTEAVMGFSLAAATTLAATFGIISVASWVICYAI